MSVRERYTKLAASKREGYLSRGRACARLTIPSLLPREGEDGGDNLYVPFQGLGARGVKKLASKLLLTLFPPNTPFFRFRVSEEDMAELEGDSKSKIEKGLSQTEQKLIVNLELKQLRNVLFEVLKQLIVCGNCLLYIGEKKVRYFRLDKYVVRRDGMGDVLEIIIKEVLKKAELTEAEAAAYENSMSEEDLGNDGVEARCERYTLIKREGDSYLVHQEINGSVVAGSHSKFAKDRLPFLALRLNAAEGEDYGRSYAEEHIGDLQTLENLMKAITQGSLAMARILFMVDPNSATQIEDITRANNLEFVVGRIEDIGILQMDKYGDFRVALEKSVEIKQDLAKAFLLQDSVTRNAERVTALEIRYMIGELEEALGGVYSLLATELQAPLVAIEIAAMEKKGQAPHMPKDLVKPQVVTGVEALGRNSELEKLRTLLEYLKPLGEQAISQNLEVDDYITRLATALFLDTEGLVPTKEDKAARANQQQQQQMMEKFGPEVLKLAASNPEALQGMGQGMGG